MQLIQLRQNHIVESVKEVIFSTFSRRSLELLQGIFEGLVEIFGAPIFQKSSELLLLCNGELRYLSIKWKSVDKICEILC